jgi:hypothetical protein
VVEHFGTPRSPRRTAAPWPGWSARVPPRYAGRPMTRLARYRELSHASSRRIPRTARPGLTSTCPTTCQTRSRSSEPPRTWSQGPSALERPRPSGAQSTHCRRPRGASDGAPRHELLGASAARRRARPRWASWPSAASPIAGPRTNSPPRRWPRLSMSRTPENLLREHVNVAGVRSRRVLLMRGPGSLTVVGEPETAKSVSRPQRPHAPFLVRRQRRSIAATYASPHLG